MEIPDLEEEMELKIFSIVGVEKKSLMLNAAAIQDINLQGLSQGMYQYEIRKDGERISGGVIQIK